MTPLLERQLRRAFNLDDTVTLERWLDDLKSKSDDDQIEGTADFKQGLASLISRVDESYAFFERDITLRDRSLRISSEELMTVNKKVRQEYGEQKAVIETLRRAVNQLLEERNKPLIDENFTNLSDLSALTYELINEQKNANNELLLQRKAMDKHGIVATIDLNGILLSANDKCCQLSGYSRDELIGKSTNIFRVQNIPIAEQTRILATLIKGEIWQGELHSFTKTNEPWTVFATVVPIVEYNKRVNRLVVICTDMSEQMRLARKLREDRAFHQSITNSIGEGVYAVNGEGKAQFLNPAASRLLGWTVEELEDRRFHDTVHYQKGDGTLLPREECPVNLSIRAGKSYASYEDYFTDKRGRLFPISIVAVPLLDEDGRPDGHVGVFSDISSRKAIEHKLQKAYDTAQGANKAKSDFLATMSHEIRTPMNAIIGLTHLALETQDEDQRQQYLEKVQRSSNALLELMNSILDFSKVEADKVDILNEPFTLTKTIEKLAQVFQVKAQQKGLQLLFDIRYNTNSPCRGDSEKIYQVLLNLLSNAIKFTDNGYVVLKVNKREDKLFFSVSDTGMGISNAGKSKLFNAFVQADASISRKFGGTGLGLAICKRLVELMGGELTLKSKIHEGSCFAFSLPVCVDEGPVIKPFLPVSLPSDVLCIQTHDSVAQGCQILAQTLKRLSINCEIVDEHKARIASTGQQTIAFLSDNEASWKVFLDRLNNNDDVQLRCNIIVSPLSRADVQKRLGKKRYNEFRFVELPFSDRELISALSPLELPFTEAAKERLESKKWRIKRLSNKRILVVDDDLISLEISQQILVDLGMTVVTAATGEHALTLCESNTFDAILLDCHLPGISGYDVADKLVNREGWLTPIIALSADETNEASEKALTAGMCYHLVKPATADEIVHTIDSHIHAGYIDIDAPERADEFTISLLAFYTAYSQRSVMTDLLNIIQSPSHTSDLLNALLVDARKIGATTLERCLEVLLESLQRPDTAIAKHVSDLSYALDATLRLIAHTIDKNDEIENTNVDPDVDNGALLASLKQTKDALETYDAKALEHISLLAAQFSESSHAHTIAHLKQLTSVYDFESALTVIETLINDVIHEST